jgi:hypothetical protein
MGGEGYDWTTGAGWYPIVSDQVVEEKGEEERF